MTHVELFLSFLSDCTVRTTDNKCCVFPFLYEGERHFTCASTFFGEKWCATTYNYDEDEEWGECLGLLNFCRYIYFHPAAQVWSERDEVTGASSKIGSTKLKFTTVLVNFLRANSVARVTSSHPD